MALQRLETGRSGGVAAVGARDVAVLRCEGEMGTMELAHLCDELFVLTHRGCTKIVLDLSGLEHVDYRGLKPLATRARLLKNAGGGVAIAGPTPYVAAIFRAAGFEADFPLYRTAEEAKLAFVDEPALALVRS